MFMSTLTPGNALSLYMIATVEMTSTRVAVKPPCSVPPRLVCSSSTRISHTTLPGMADRTSTWREKRECFRVVANQFLFPFFFLTDGAPLVQPVCQWNIAWRSFLPCSGLGRSPDNLPSFAWFVLWYLRTVKPSLQNAQTRPMSNLCVYFVPETARS